MGEPKKLSVVVPAYQGEKLLPLTLPAIAQSDLPREQWELIVVDDGSSDGTAEWVESLADPRVKVIREKHTGNRSRLRNLGVRESRADWIAFLDSDDVWLPEKLSLQLERIVAHPHCRWSCTAIRFVDGEGKPIPQRSGIGYRAQSGWILEGLLTFTAAATMPTLMMHRSLFDDVGGFDETFLLREDYEFELRVAGASEIHALAEPLTIVRDHAGRTSSTRRVADLHRGSARVFRKVATWAPNKRIRDICRRQCGIQLAWQARALSREGEHGAAMQVAARAIREAPLSSETWRAAVGSVLRFLRLRAQ